MKTKSLIKKIGLGLGASAILLGDLSADPAPAAQRTFCAAVGFKGAIATFDSQAEQTAPCTVVDTTNPLAAWVSFVKGGALIGTLYFGYKGSGIGDGDTFDIKKVAAAGGLAALSLQYAPIMKMISEFFI
jgi:hypothetical protein